MTPSPRLSDLTDPSCWALGNPINRSTRDRFLLPGRYSFDIRPQKSMQRPLRSQSPKRVGSRLFGPLLSDGGSVFFALADLRRWSHLTPPSTASSAKGFEFSTALFLRFILPRGASRLYLHVDCLAKSVKCMLQVACGGPVFQAIEAGATRISQCPGGRAQSFQRRR